MAFYNHALQALQVGRTKFAELGIPFNRPDDYFCESLKSDAHMARVCLYCYYYYYYFIILLKLKFIMMNRLKID